MLIMLARKPLRSGATVAHNCLGTGTGGLNIDATRISTADNLNGGAYAKNGTARDDGWTMSREGRAGPYVQSTGRWPANVLLAPCAIGPLDAQSGDTKSGVSKEVKVSQVKGQFVANATTQPGVNQHADRGGASRYFYKVGSKL